MKMNTLKMIVVTVIIGSIVAACGGSSEDKSAAADEKETAAAEEVTYMVDTAETKVKWEGKVVGVYGHYGLIDVEEGSLTAMGDSLTGGTIMIDMTTIAPKDSSSYKDEEGRRASDLVGHLSTGDFFLVEEYPTASFVVKSHSGNTVTGDLTVRGNTYEETIELSSLETSDGGLMSKGKLVFDRQKYDVKWEHFVEDYVLSDDIVLEFDLVASK